MTFFDHFFAADKSYFDVPVSDQENFLKKLGKASSDLDRSYKQYRSQLFFYSHKKRLILSTSSFVLLIFLLPYYIIRGLFIKKVKRLMQYVVQTRMHNLSRIRYWVNMLLTEQNGIQKVPFIGRIFHT